MIPIKDDQATNRRKLGSRSGRPPAFDKEAYKQHHAVNVEYGMWNQRSQATPYRGHASTSSPYAHEATDHIATINIWLRCLDATDDTPP